MRQIASGAAKDVTMFGIYPREYRKAAKAPVDPRKVLFIEGKLATMPDSFQPVQLIQTVRLPRRLRS
jgi:hypothetical protein